MLFFVVVKKGQKKVNFLLPVERRRKVKELLYFLNNMEQTDLDDDSMTSRHQKLSLHLFFLKSLFPFSTWTHTYTHAQLITEETYNELPLPFPSQKVQQTGLDCPWGHVFPIFPLNMVYCFAGTKCLAEILISSTQISGIIFCQCVIQYTQACATRATQAEMLLPATTARLSPLALDILTTWTTF